MTEPESGDHVVLHGFGALGVVKGHVDERLVIDVGGDIAVLDVSSIVVPSVHACMRWRHRVGDNGRGDTWCERVARSWLRASDVILEPSSCGLYGDEVRYDEEQSVALVRRGHAVVTVMDESIMKPDLKSAVEGAVR